MEFGLVGIDGSGLVKRERSDPFENESNKMGKWVDDYGLRSEDKQQMLSFSSTDKPELVSFLSAKDLRLVSDRDDSSFYYHQTPSSTPSTFNNYSRTSPGFGTGNMNGGMHVSFTGIRGPFTPAQWIELEHQAMIYKYFTANVPVPSNLLIPIRKAIQSAGFPGFSIGSYPSHSYGWGSFHLGFSGSTDPEPGRCRRTDGKKWRCSRDAVPDQKYCERHINRGRHRSRKPVEGHTGQAASGATTTKVLPPMSSSMSSLVTSGAGVPNGDAISQHHVKGLQPAGTTNPSTDPITKRVKDQQGLSVMPSTINLDSKDSQYSIPKQHMSFDETSMSDFGVVSNDSFLNPTQKSSYLDCKSYNSLMEFNNQQTQDQSSVRHFMEKWPKAQSHRSAAPWSKDLKSDWAQLSMSIPMSTDFSSSSSSPNQGKVTLSPLKLSRELDPSQVGLGAGTGEWGNSMGGPLGEVLLNNASNAIDKGERWDGSPQFGASPTGVLYKSTFVSVSNSSSVGSPTGASSKTLEGVSVIVS
ncbi:growth-regulating factor 1-like isoform X1 [Silene latifolia]|uniref:growth-regulating factor 1-like isoform X1 n=1 Tax=Silene latifolia TaxID=37657 RepID=UPI003D7853D6